MPCDVDVFDFCTIIMKELGLQFPSTGTQALDLDLHLSDVVPQIRGQDN